MQARSGTLATLSGVLATTLSIASLAAVSGSIEVLPNGDFESGPTVWTEVSALGYDLILHQSELPAPVTPHAGEWATWLGGDDDELAYIEQEVTVPSPSPILKYWHWIDSFDDCGFDFASVVIDGSTVLDTYDLCDAANTGGWALHTVDLSAYAGLVVTLQIRVETDEEFGTESSLFVDDVFFEFDSPANLIFEDGFESGDTSAWS